MCDISFKANSGFSLKKAINNSFSSYLKKAIHSLTPHHTAHTHISFPQPTHPAPSPSLPTMENYIQINASSIKKMKKKSKDTLTLLSILVLLLISLEKNIYK